MEVVSATSPVVPVATTRTIAARDRRVCRDRRSRNERRRKRFVVDAYMRSMRTCDSSVVSRRRWIVTPWV